MEAMENTNHGIRKSLFSYFLRQRARILTLYYKRRFWHTGKRLLINGRIAVTGKVDVGNNVAFTEGGSELYARGNGAITIGDNVCFDKATIVSTISIEIGNNVVISRWAVITDHNGYGLDGNAPIEKPVKICDRVWIGMRAMILKGVTVGENSIVGAMSVVTKDVEPNTIVAGNPAHEIRKTKGYVMTNTPADRRLFLGER